MNAPSARAILGASVIDISTNKPLSVSTDGDSGPYIIVPVEQLEKVKALLDSDSIKYWVDEEAISLDGEPELTVINLGRTVDVAKIQRILDAAR